MLLPEQQQALCSLQERIKEVKELRTSIFFDLEKLENTKWGYTLFNGTVLAPGDYMMQAYKKLSDALECLEDTETEMKESMERINEA